MNRFCDTLRHVLQRDILGIGVRADQGTWGGMEHYLRDDAFQTQTSKLLIWEMPERDMRAPPNYEFRDARYIATTPSGCCAPLLGRRPVENRPASQPR